MCVGGSQMREVVAYAAARFIEVVPEVELPGHCCSALASYPHLGCAHPLPLNPSPIPRPRVRACLRPSHSRSASDETDGCVRS